MIDHPTDGELARELLPCPFCGPEAFVKPCPLVVYSPDTYAVGCPQCKTKGPWGTEAEAATAWNTRTATPEQPANTDHTDAALADELRQTADRYRDTMGLTRDGAIRRIEKLHDALLDAADKITALRTPAPVNCTYEYWRSGEQWERGECFLHPDTCPKCASNPTAEQPAEPQPSVVERFIAALPSWIPAGHVDEARKALIAALASSRSSETELLRRAVELRDDLLSRAEWDGDAKVVVAGAGAWVRFNDAIDATLTNGDG